MTTERPRLVLMRFSPFSAYKLELNAKATFEEDVVAGRQGRYGLSLYGTHISQSDPIESALDGVCRTVPVGGKRVALAWADELRESGWTIVEDVPPEHHYLMGVGDLTEMPDGEQMAIVWSAWRIRNPAWKSEE